MELDGVVSDLWLHHGAQVDFVGEWDGCAARALARASTLLGWPAAALPLLSPCMCPWCARPPPQAARPA
jgi:hypothetical protein